MLGPWEFVLVSLTAYRLTRFFVFDSLLGANLESRSKFSRRLDTWAWTAEGNDKGWVRGKVAGLLVCPFCLGFWISLAVVAAFSWAADIAFAGWVQLGVLVFAVAGLQSLLSQIERRLAHG